MLNRFFFKQWKYCFKIFLENYLENILGRQRQKIHWHRKIWVFLGTFEQQSHVSYWFLHDVEQVVIRGQILWVQYLHLRVLSHKFKHLISWRLPVLGTLSFTKVFGGSMPSFSPIQVSHSGKRLAILQKLIKNRSGVR